MFIMNGYYDVSLKGYRLSELNEYIIYADTTPLEKEFGFKPNTSLREGLRKFAEWYKEFYIDRSN